MRIDTIEKYNKYPDGTIFNMFLSGDDWKEEYGSAFKVIKVGDKLYEIKPAYYRFSERNDNGNYGEDYSFEISINDSEFKRWKELTS